MTTQFWWIRHGPTHATGMAGWRDIPADLSDRAGLARLEAGLPPDGVVVSSDLVRATATADAVQGARSRLAHRAGLRELNFGDWDGRAFSDIAKEDPEGSRAFWQTPGSFAPPGGESWDAFSARVQANIAELSAAHAGEKVIVVAHFAVILAAIQLAGGLTSQQVFRFKIDNLSLSEMHQTQGGESWRIHRINHVL